MVANGLGNFYRCRNSAPVLGPPSDLCLASPPLAGFSYTQRHDAIHYVSIILLKRLACLPSRTARLRHDQFNIFLFQVTFVHITAFVLFVVILILVRGSTLHRLVLACGTRGIELTGG